MELNLSTVLELMNSLGTLGLLAFLFYLFLRGDLMSRKVYEELTRNIMGTLVQKIIDELRDVLDDWHKEYHGKE